MIRFTDTSFRYCADDAVPWAFADLHLELADGTFTLVIGDSGSGKSTMLRAINGIVPHTTGGELAGHVVVGGRDTRNHPPRLLADLVGFVHQDPEAAFVVDQVEHDIAFTLENLGTEPGAMRRRVEEVLDALGIAHLRHRAPATLSGGERQRAAIAGALAAGPRVLVLDEPTSQLDPQGTDDVIAAISRLNQDLGTTVVLAEHRIDRVASYTDDVIELEAGRMVRRGRPHDVVVGYAGAPTVTELGLALGWSPAPLTVKEARRFAREQRPPRQGGPLPVTPPVPAGPAPATAPSPTVAGEVLVRAEGVQVELGGRVALRNADLAVHEGDVVAVLGRNGAGKTTLLRALAGLQAARRGRVVRRGTTRVAAVPQDPNSMLFRPTVRAEVAHTAHLLGQGDHAVAEWLERLDLMPLAERHPRTLSAGQRQRVAVAAVAVGGAEVLLLDEPTRGIDASSRAALEGMIRTHASAAGQAVVLSTHDVELAARVATRVVVLAEGEIVAEGAARDVLAGSLFAPATLRVLPPFLTVAEVLAAR